MIDSQTIAKVIDAAKIEEVVSEFVTLQKSGVNRKGLCPFHKEKTPSFVVSPSKNIYHCFGCGKGGNPVNFLMDLEHLSYVDTIKYLAKKYGITIEEREQTEEEKIEASEREIMFIINEFAAKFYQNNLWNSKEGQTIGLSYIKERGFDDATIKQFQLGYSLQQRDAFTNMAISKAYDLKYLRAVGLSKEGQYGNYDFFTARIIFPFFSLSGKIIGFGGRILTNEKTAKYINSPESQIFSKSNNLFGIFHSKQEIIKNNKCYLVEGNIDFLSLFQAGIKNTVASLGTALTKEQANIIHRFTDNVSILYDGDNAGIKAASRAVTILLEEGINVRVLLFPADEDPDSFVRKHGATATIDHINKNEKDIVEFSIYLYSKEIIKSPEKKSAAIKELLSNIALIKDEITASFFITKCSNIFEIDEKILISIFSNIKKQIIRETIKQNNSLSQLSNTFTNTNLIQDQTPVYNNTESILFENIEKEIIRLLILYGNNIIKYGTNNFSVAQIIFKNLYGDELELKNKTLNEILNYSEKIIAEKKEISITLFTNHINPKISKIVSTILKPLPELKFSKHQSNFIDEEQRLEEILNDIFLKYKTNVIKERIINLKEKINDNKQYSEDEILSFLNLLKKLEIIKKKLAEVQNRPLR